MFVACTIALTIKICQLNLLNTGVFLRILDCSEHRIMHKSSADICDYYYHYHHHDYYYYIQYNDCNESEKLSSIDALSSDIFNFYYSISIISAYFTLSERLMKN
ncbi:hypothetical protein T05_8084 [Trichinella murrelli]|uniref:Uncharacterized protein n=1 Tax=Trichinella murrelli TaxID=144512 RepID=A0A0V0TFF6_9BILA|nr:hypothetical protein T05_8084 [Trichinella murrelli]